MTDDDKWDIFNDGFIAKCDGQPLEANPYLGKDAERSGYWLDGYREAEQSVFPPADLDE